mmetsp:Transcript_122130/g.272710  ORF Transcript_122130/g.272710 Transcript_122130/m.272710 type:complete len:447 (+) Transcript_122130:121-1461(+)
MLRRFCGTGWGSNPSAAETASIEQLVVCHRQLLLEEDRVDVRSETGYSACAMFLSAMENTARTMCLEVADRRFREKFSANYRALFPDGARHYRVDVLEASVDQHSAIWVNGDKFELSEAAIGHAEALQRHWGQLGTLLARWPLSRDGEAVPESASSRPTRAELVTELESLDKAWACFEHQYIAELIAIEEQARKLIVQAVDQESRLRALEQQRAPSAIAIEEARSQLIASIAHLNSVANFRRKGRDDLGADILTSAIAVLEQQKAAGLTERSAAWILAEDVVASFASMRNYLEEVSKCLERVDPHLCNNAGLVARLVDWEESWEVGGRYVRQAPLLAGLCDLVESIQEEPLLDQALTSMCADCDVELFMILPRILLLCFSAGPGGKGAELLKSLLPHRFVGPEKRPDAEFEGLIAQFRQTKATLASGGGGAPGGGGGGGGQNLMAA